MGVWQLAPIPLRSTAIKRIRKPRKALTNQLTKPWSGLVRYLYVCMHAPRYISTKTLNIIIGLDF